MTSSLQMTSVLPWQARGATKKHALPRSSLSVHIKTQELDIVASVVQP